MFTLELIESLPRSALSSDQQPLGLSAQYSYYL